MEKVFGFDIGIASIGWSVIQSDIPDISNESEKIIEKPDERIGKIIAAGVRIFEMAENPKDGKSLAAPRRENRLARRTIRRRARRMQDIRDLFLSHDNGLSFLDEDQVSTMFVFKKRADVWDLRVAALDKKLNPEEFARVLVHIAKHRGFKSYRKSDQSQKDVGSILNAINANKSELNNYRTYAEMIVKRSQDPKSKTNKKRNSDGSYINSISRELIEEETDLIFEKQREFGNPFAGEEFQKSYKDIAFRYRKSGSIKHMIGSCTLDPNQERAPKNAVSVEFFNAWCKINNFRFGNEETRLTDEQRKQVFDLLKHQKSVKISTIKKKILNDDVVEIKGFKSDSNEKFFELIGFHKLKDSLKERWGEYESNVKLLDEIVCAIASQKDDVSIADSLKSLGIPDTDVELLTNLSFSKYGHLSLSVIYNILGGVEAGKTYSEACKDAGYDHTSTGQAIGTPREDGLLPVIPQQNLTTVPVVNRAISQLRKVYNAMVRKYGKPDRIHLEFARDLNHSKQERSEIQKRQEENRKNNDIARQKIAENFGIEAKGRDILKYVLYEQQECKCMYSNKPIEIERLFEPGYCEIDHIIPYSRSLDDRQRNRVLCLAKENQEKRNRTPYEYFGSDEKRWNDFELRIQSLSSLSGAKRRLLLMKDFMGDKEYNFRERNLNDTRYIARFVRKYFEDCIDFSDSKKNKKQRILTVNGAVTAYLRNQWGVKKNREENDKHHALDATVIACATPSMIKYFSNLSKYVETKSYDKKSPRYEKFKKRITQPWNGFDEDLSTKLDGLFVSRKPSYKVTGEAHAQTIRKKQDVKNGLEVRGGKAENSKMVRVDVFSKADTKGRRQFYLVPIYVSDTIKPELPKKAIVASKKPWIEMDASYEFNFSLYKNDLIKIKTKDKEGFFYYNSTHSANGSINIEPIDGSMPVRVGGISVGVKTTLLIFEKWRVDVLGNTNKVKEEKRQAFNIKK